MRKISVKGILLGILCALSLSFLTGIGLTFAFVDMSQPKEYEAAIAALSTSTPYLIICIIDGLLITAFGGYTAARIAKRAPFFNAGWVGVAFLVFQWLAAEELPLWYSATAFLLAIPASLLGGYLVFLRKTQE